jgi:hypothetical protein
MKARELALFTVILAVFFMAFAAPSALSQQDEAQPPRHYKLSEVFISITRGSCEGECPIYTVAVHGGGMVAYQGEENVATTGQQVEMISPQAVENLLNAVYSAGFMDMRDSYLSSIAPKVTEGGVVILEYRGATGSPRSILILTIGGYTKQVVFQPEHAPSDLVKLADLIDELTGSAKWTKGR